MDVQIERWKRDGSNFSNPAVKWCNLTRDISLSYPRRLKQKNPGDKKGMQIQWKGNGTMHLGLWFN